MNIAGIILAGGKGTRINSHKVNKVTLPFHGKALINYGVELLIDIANPIVVVVGAYAKSVKDCLKDYSVGYAYQQKRLGTAQATKIGLSRLVNQSPTPEIVIVGYGDHMMFYKKETIKKMLAIHNKEKAAITIITTIYSNPNALAWGRIIRDENGKLIDSIEQKDATEEQKKINEVNPNFNCFDYSFLIKNINKIKKSPISGEYYLPDLIKIAIKQNQKVVGLKVPFNEVGIGINKLPELQESQNLYFSNSN